ncbi:MAG: hypothetical protein EBR79_02525, partial [Proteobacteria bacterium]|nr:hypothetical protein [Pseudomonadota bacterium]
QIVKVLGLEPFQVALRGPVVQLHGLGEGIREDMLVETLGNINSALVSHGVFVREALLGHIVAERQPFWLLEVSRPLSELTNEILDSVARRLHAEIDLRSVAYRTAYRGAAFKGPQVHFVPMGTFAAAFSASPQEFSQFDHTMPACAKKCWGWRGRVS